jgi:hypothetical protein
MTPKEKAQELFEKFFQEADLSVAKGCALIAVDEIINVIIGSYDYELENKYWQEVKNQIKLL